MVKVAIGAKTCANQCEATAYQIELRQRDAEIERLRSIINKAPHDTLCAYMNHHGAGKPECDCWKATALRGEG